MEECMKWIHQKKELMLTHALYLEFNLNSKLAKNWKKSFLSDYMISNIRTQKFEK